MAKLTIFCHALFMSYEIDVIPSEEEGDGLPNMRWRLRVISASVLGGLAAWIALLFLMF
jgi:hypothetical protein